MTLRECAGIHLLLFSPPELSDVLCGRESGSYLDFLTSSTKSCGVRDEKGPSCERRADGGTYDPSGRFDSGMTRSRVLGSTAMPDGVDSGYRGGLDIAWLWEGGGEGGSGVAIMRLDSFSVLTRHHPLCSET